MTYFFSIVFSIHFQYHLNPTYTPEEVTAMAFKPHYGKALDGTDFIPGCTGLNNLKETDYFNVIIQVGLSCTNTVGYHPSFGSSVSVLRCRPCVR